MDQNPDQAQGGTLQGERLPEGQQSPYVPMSTHTSPHGYPSEGVPPPKYILPPSHPPKGYSYLEPDEGEVPRWARFLRNMGYWGTPLWARILMGPFARY